ncbi:hypothetical protein XI09_03785 [Bradyrhizobium sp. CCBAU 11386]|nr:hypothetical protein [Bradyrhizobium sp. CCBAU 11386]
MAFCCDIVKSEFAEAAYRIGQADASTGLVYVKGELLDPSRITHEDMSGADRRGGRGGGVRKG